MGSQLLTMVLTFHMQFIVNTSHAFQTRALTNGGKYICQLKWNKDLGYHAVKP